MTMSLSVTISGQTDGVNHRQVISDVAKAIEIAMKMSDPNAGVQVLETAVTMQSVPFKVDNSGQPTGSPSTRTEVSISGWCHVDEPAPAPKDVPDQAAQPPQEETKAADPATDQATPESSDGSASSQG